MPGFYQDAQTIFETAQAGAENVEFALLVRADGGLHMIMESPVSLEGAVAYTGAATAYHVSRSAAGVSVNGVSQGKSCRLESAAPAFRASQFLRDRPLYTSTSTAYPGERARNMPQITCASSSCLEGA